MTPSIPPQLEAYISYPFVSGLTASADGRRLAWIETRKGVRNIWLAVGPDFVAQRVTDATLDDGQELSGLAFSPDDQTLVWVRGGGEHNGWANGLPAPNPASAVEQPQMEIWAAFGGSPPLKVAEGEEPTLSSTGKLAYIKDNQAWTVDLSGKGKPSKVFYDRGKVGELTWSPDGRKLAFVSRRGDHSFIGVYQGPDRPLLWLEPATAYDGSPVWSPDGLQVAFIRQNGVSDIAVSNLEEKPRPFSIWVGSAESGEGRAVWRSPNTLNGSYPQVPDGLFLMWGAADRLTFRAEMDGWPHLYSVSSRGGDLTLLTPGDFMVEHVVMAPDRGSLFYSANAGALAGDADRRHLYRVHIDRADPTPLTPGQGLEWTPAPVEGAKLAFIGSTATTPMKVAIIDQNGGPTRTLSSSSAAYSPEFVAPRPVSFRAADGLMIHGQLFEPAQGKSKRPGLIFVHGGPTRQMLLGWSYMDYYTHSYAMNQYLASRGYVVLSVNYRLGIGYGRSFQHAPRGGAAGNSEYQDVVAGARFLQSLPKVDPARIGIWGGSYGGLLTAQALARNSDIFKVGVDFHGVHDWSLYPGKVVKPQRYEEGDYEAAMKSAFESSPDSALAGWRSPVLLIQGDDDRNVRFDQTVDLARRLAAQETPFKELILPNEIHGFLRYDSWLRADAASVHFLEDVLHP
jgi:dipeptidyl aminopeptidase/acylaminoacyl peptidase